jgi:hypothetical protein
MQIPTRSREAENALVREFMINCFFQLRKINDSGKQFSAVTGGKVAPCVLKTLNRTLAI